jgi:parvulin-like peptidyl-prolyl isomerase
MKKISQVCVLLCAIAPLAAFSVTPDQPASTNSTGKAPSLDALFGDAVVAKGKGVEVKREDLDAMVFKMKANLAQSGTPAPADAESQVLKKLVIDQLILSKATDADRTSAKTNFEDWVGKVKVANHMTSDEDFDKAASRQLSGGETLDQWKKQQIDIRTEPIVLQRELKVNVTDDDIKKFYDDPANIAHFEEPETVDVSHILLVTTDPKTNEPLSEDKKAAKHKQLEDLLKRARAGEDFAKMADQYSEDPGVKENHGEYKFSRADRYVQEFKDAAFALAKPGDVSDIITSQFGYHIIKLNQKIPAKKADLSDVKDAIKEHLVQEQFRKLAPAYVATLVKNANIQIMDDKLKGTDFSIEPPKEEAAPAGASAAPTAPPASATKK